MEKKEQMYEGKAKRVYATDDSTLVIVSYQDDATAFNGLKKGTHAGSLTTYSSDNLDGENTLDNPTKYVPQTKEITVEGTTINVNIAPKSFAMYKIKK